MKFTTRTGKRELLSTPAPAYFPYHHRTLAGHTDCAMLDRYERNARRFNAGRKDWRISGETAPESLNVPPMFAMERAAPDGFCRADPEPDQSNVGGS